MVALALKEALPGVVQAIEPWISSSDLDPGVMWHSNIEFALETSEFAIVLVTPENLNSPWLNYEVGVLAKKVGAARICPYLVDFSPSQLTGPLVQFQAVEASETGTWRLVRSLNELLDDRAIQEGRLKEAFDLWWPKVAVAIEAAKSPAPIDAAKGSLMASELERVLRSLSAAPAQPQAAGLCEERPFVFLVHGRAHGAAEMVARFVEKLGPRVVILHEQANEGRTIIEKFEQHSNVAFSIALLTQDDIGGLSGESPTSFKPRARQNVIFELGYFIGKLGRRLVAVLYEDGVELPSDYLGVAYIQLDSPGAWRLTLARELRASSVAVDLNNAL